MALLHWAITVNKHTTPPPGHDYVLTPRQSYTTTHPPYTISYWSLPPRHNENTNF